ncbi:MAG TPA: hypothetical protein VFA43_15705 [Gemmatimonadaceae bacterium]|nr:hypothetical protein [Gemmatimonadaceae bacterium]
MKWVVIGLALLACAPENPCGRPGPPPHREWTDDIAFIICSDPVPPHARSDTKFTVIARDKASGQPIEGADGRIYAERREGVKTWDGFVPGPKPGTYTAKLNFVISGNWAMGMQFRRDTMANKIEKMDWTQEVLSASDTNEVR